MTLLPGWHPLVVHFPLALVVTATPLLLAARLVRRSEFEAVYRSGTRRSELAFHPGQDR